MVYIKDFQYLKPKTSRTSSLQTFNRTTNIKKQTSLTSWKEDESTSQRKMLKAYVREYLDTSTLHGLRYLIHPKFKCYEKFIWLLIIIGTTIACSFVYFDLAELYYNQRLHSTSPFPSIAICPRYRINWQRLHNEATKKFLPPDASNETLKTFLAFFEQLSDIQFSSLKNLKHLIRMKLNFTLIDAINVLEVMEFLALPCTEAFSEFCRWRTKYYNCCELFIPERTESGVCYVFNSEISPSGIEKAKNNSFYPYHNSFAGEGTGLEARVRIDENKVKPNYKQVQGLYVMIKPTTQWYADARFVNFDTFTKVAITAQVTNTVHQVRVLEPEDRKCIFTDERNHFLYKEIPGLKYWRGNCRIRCHQEYVLKYCKCNMDLFHPNTRNDNFTSCKPSDFKCIYEHANIFNMEHHIYENQYIEDVVNESMTCNCLNNCNQLIYDGYFNSVPLVGLDSDTKVKLVHLDVYFQSTYILKYCTSMRYSIVELLANFGGIIGLFLGASFLSAIEFIYYFTIGLWARFRGQERRVKRSTRSLTIHVVK